MRNTRNSIWKDKVFLSMMTVCLIAIVAVAANMVSGRRTDKKDPIAEYTTSQSETEEQTAAAQAKIGIEEGGAQVDGADQEGIKTAAGVEANGTKTGKAEVSQESPKSAEAADQAKPEPESKEVAEAEPQPESEEAVRANTANQMVLQYDGTTAMTWPAEGEVLMEFAMDHTVYHATLEQYKVNPGLVIQAEVGAHVTVPAVGLVQEIGWNEEIGNYMRLDLGNGYAAVIGDLENITVQPGQYVAPGNILGTVAAPTKYYAVEGPNVYFALTKDGVACDPLQYLE